MKDAERKFDLAFVLRDCNGDIAAAQRRIDKALTQARNEALEEAAKACRDYAHSGSVSMMRRQVAYACENRVRALKSGAGEEGR